MAISSAPARSSVVSMTPSTKAGGGGGAASVDHRDVARDHPCPCHTNSDQRMVLGLGPVVPIAVDIWGVDGGFAMDLNILTMDLRWICLFDTFFAWCEACAQNFLHTVGNLHVVFWIAYGGFAMDLKILTMDLRRIIRRYRDHCLITTSVAMPTAIRKASQMKANWLPDCHEGPVCSAEGALPQGMSQRHQRGIARFNDEAFRTVSCFEGGGPKPEPKPERQAYVVEVAGRVPGTLGKKALGGNKVASWN